jgi:hypothetical protein
MNSVPGGGFHCVTPGLHRASLPEHPDTAVHHAAAVTGNPA